MKPDSRLFGAADALALFGCVLLGGGLLGLLYNSSHDGQLGPSAVVACAGLLGCGTALYSLRRKPRHDTPGADVAAPLADLTDAQVRAVLLALRAEIVAGNRRAQTMTFLQGFLFFGLGLGASVVVGLLTS